MARSYIESVLAGTLPSFATEWDAHRRAYPPGTLPTEADFLVAFRAHVISLLGAGHVAETTRFFYAVEQLLGEADPVLRELIERDLLGALATDCARAAIDSRRVEPYLGARTRAVWTPRNADRRADNE